MFRVYNVMIMLLSNLRFEGSPPRRPKVHSPPRGGLPGPPGIGRSPIFARGFKSRSPPRSGSQSPPRFGGPTQSAPPRGGGMRRNWGANSPSPTRQGRSPPPRSLSPPLRSRPRLGGEPVVQWNNPPIILPSVETADGGHWEIPPILRRIPKPSSKDFSEYPTGDNEEPSGASKGQSMMPVSCIANTPGAGNDRPSAPDLMHALLSGKSGWLAAASQVLGGGSVAEESNLMGPRGLLDPKQALSSRHLPGSVEKTSLIALEDDSSGTIGALRKAVNKMAMEVNNVNNIYLFLLVIAFI